MFKFAKIFNNSKLSQVEIEANVLQLLPCIA